jgi:hypothetical protein
MKEHPTTTQAWRAHFQICPITSGLETKMPESTYRRLCNNHRRSAKSKELIDSGDPYAKFCRECKGKIVPVELTFIEI